MPECLDDFIDESNPVRIIDVFVDGLDLAEMSFDNFLRIRSKIRELEARRMGFRSPPAALIDCDGAQAIRKRGNNVFPGMVEPAQE